MSLLEVRDLVTAYGSIEALHGVPDQAIAEYLRSVVGMAETSQAPHESE